MFCHINNVYGIKEPCLSVRLKWLSICQTKMVSQVKLKRLYVRLKGELFRLKWSVKLERLSGRLKGLYQAEMIF